MARTFEMRQDWTNTVAGVEQLLGFDEISMKLTPCFISSMLASKETLETENQVRGPGNK